MGKVLEMKRFLEMQKKCLDDLDYLIEFDKKMSIEHGITPENTRCLRAFNDSQRKIIDLSVKLLVKHENRLLDLEKIKVKETEKKTSIESIVTSESKIDDKTENLQDINLFE